MKALPTGSRLPVPVAVAWQGSAHQLWGELEKAEETPHTGLPWADTQAVPGHNGLSRGEALHQAGESG